MRLSDQTLSQLDACIRGPGYDRSTITPGIVHLGIGAFYRAHGAAYIDACLARGERDWGIVGASLRSPETRDALAPQDGLYTLALRESERTQLRVVGALQEILVAPEAPGRLLDRLSDPAIRIVTLTITEKGYAVDLGTGTLRRDHPDIQHDLAAPQAPRSALGFLAEAIARRRALGLRPFTILSCDNLPQNGRTLRRVLTEFAGLRSPDLAAYVEEAVACPSSMVDRIVPATTPDDRQMVAAALGLEDAWPVMGEPFGQWVIEDVFPAGRPGLEASGVEFVADVQPYEHMKLRLLNGTHSTLAAVGRLAGLETVADAIGQPDVRAFIERYWTSVIPTLTLEPARAHAYTRQLLERYDNAALRHRTAQIAMDASQKLPQRIIAALRECLARGLPCQPLIFAVAAWIRSCGGLSDAGEALPLNDPTFQAWSGRPDQRAATPREVVQAFLALTSVFGEDLPRHQAFVAALEEHLATIARDGVLAAIAARVA